MTQKELAYVEDAIGHEKTIIKMLEESANMLDGEELQKFLLNDIKTHNKMLKSLVKLLEDEANE